MTRDECLGKGKAKKRGGRDGDGGEASRGRLGESQAETDEDKHCWWTGRFGVLRGGGGGKTTRTGEGSLEGEARGSQGGESLH